MLYVPLNHCQHSRKGKLTVQCCYLTWYRLDRVAWAYLFFSGVSRAFATFNLNWLPSTFTCNRYNVAIWRPASTSLSPGKIISSSYQLVCSENIFNNIILFQLFINYCKYYRKQYPLHAFLLRGYQASQQTNSGCVRYQPGLPVLKASLIWDFLM